MLYHYQKKQEVLESLSSNPQTGLSTQQVEKLTEQYGPNRLKEKTPFASFIDLSGSLTLDSFYKTDTHWRQEQLGDAAGTVAAAMGKKLTMKPGWQRRIFLAFTPGSRHCRLRESRCITCGTIPLMRWKFRIGSETGKSASTT